MSIRVQSADGCDRNITAGIYMDVWLYATIDDCKVVTHTRG